MTIENGGMTIENGVMTITNNDEITVSDVSNFVSNFSVITKNIIELEKVNPDAKMPVCADEGSSGYDICSVEEVTLEPGEFKIVKTGLKWSPKCNSLEMQIRPRSGLAAKHGVTVLNAPGTVDASYRGEIGVILINHSKVAYKIEKGDRIAQAVIMRVEKDFDFEFVNAVSNTSRGEGGFGSTGK